MITAFVQNLPDPTPVIESPLVISSVVSLATIAIAPLAVTLSCALLVGVAVWSDPTLIPKSLLMELTLATNIALNTLFGVPFFTRILEESNLHVGSLPLRDHGHLEDIRAMGITGVLALVEPFELETDTLFGAPIRGTEYFNQGIAFKQISVQDLTSPTLERVREGVDFIHDHFGNVLVHCKAGRGRSMLVATCYLMDALHLDQYEAEERIAERRMPYLTTSQRDTLTAYAST
ncbi:MAG: hypothetical protein SP1CHLAM54_10120 [Chlamydiia bacterium]|nr:hypothetical protein [Chlamydiia bacterium]MCH9615918.1 hypothetical protein [Chlamydiia bacterium]MCH9628679.1 hypothetical protein [Chlamydiia bacterium]